MELTCLREKDKIVFARVAVAILIRELPDIHAPTIDRMLVLLFVRAYSGTVDPHITCVHTVHRRHCLSTISSYCRKCINS